MIPVDFIPHNLETEVFVIPCRETVKETGRLHVPRICLTSGISFCAGHLDHWHEDNKCIFAVKV